jgi:hypothetical protein
LGTFEGPPWNFLEGTLERILWSFFQTCTFEGLLKACTFRLFFFF